MALAEDVHLCHSAESAWLQKEPGELFAVQTIGIGPHGNLSRHCLACCLSPEPRNTCTSCYSLETRQEGQDCSKQLRGQHACSIMMTAIRRL